MNKYMYFILKFSTSLSLKTERRYDSKFILIGILAECHNDNP